MATSWEQVSQSKAYKDLPREHQDAVRQQYFLDNIAPKVPKDKLDAVWNLFLEDTKPKMTLTGRAAEAGKAAVKGFGETLVAAPLKAAGILAAGAQAGPSVTPTGESRTETNPLFQVGQEVTNVMEKMAPSDPLYQNALTTQFGQALGQVGAYFVPGLGEAGLARAGFALPKATRLVSSTALAVSSGASQGWQDAKANGASDEDAFKAAMADAGLATSNVILPERMFRNLTKPAQTAIGDIIKEGLIGFILEGGQEAGEQIGQNLVASKYVKYDPDRGLFEGAPQAGGVGGAVGFFLNALVRMAAPGHIGPGGPNISQQPELPLNPDRPQLPPPVHPALPEPAITPPVQPGQAPIAPGGGDYLRHVTDMVVKQRAEETARLRRAASGAPIIDIPGGLQQDQGPVLQRLSQNETATERARRPPTPFTQERIVPTDLTQEGTRLAPTATDLVPRNTPVIPTRNELAGLPPSNPIAPEPNLTTQSTPVSQPRLPTQQEIAQLRTPKLQAKLQQIEDGARADIAALSKKHGQLNDITQAGIEAGKYLAAWSKIGAVKIARGAVRFGEWAGQMLREFGQAISRHLRPIWDRSVALLNNESGAIDFGKFFGFGKKPKSAPKTQPKKPVNPNQKYAASINLNRRTSAADINSEADVRRFVIDVAEANKNFAKQRGGLKVSHADVIRAAKKVGVSPREILAKTPKDFLTPDRLAALMLAHDRMLAKFSRAAERALSTGSEGDILAAHQALAQYNLIAGYYSGAATHAARALNILGRISDQTISANRAQAINDFLDTHGGRDQMLQIARLFAATDTAEGKARFARKAFQPKLSDKLIEIWINGLLSGPQTHAVNMTSNQLVQIWALNENFLAAALGKFHGGEKVYFRDSIARAYGMTEGMKDAVKMLGHAASQIAQGQEVRFDDITQSLIDQLGLFDKTENSRYRSIKGLKGKIIRSPGTALALEDVFFKVAAYRSELRQRLMRSAIQHGLKGDAMTQYIAKGLIDPEAEVPSLHLASVEAAHYLTFTNRLGPIGRRVLAFSHTHPAFRVIMPFIRTPTNIVKFFYERTPLALTNPEIRQAIFGDDNVARDLALARIGMGTGIGAMMATLAMQGLVTGAGPSEPEKRAVWLLDNQPFSAKVGNEWVSYGRLEPLGMSFGISADIGTILRDFPEVLNDQGTMEALGFAASAVVISAGKNITSKTWLKGLSDVINAMEDPDRFASAYIKNLAGTAVPAGVAQTTRVIDPTLREARTIVDRILSRLPGQSEKLLPKLDIFGRPIVLEGGVGPDLLSPAYLKTIKGDVVASEMLRLKVFPGKLPEEIGGAKLSPLEYHEYQRLAGQGFYHIAQTLVNSPNYDRMPDGVRETILRRVLSNARNVARNQILIRNPNLIREGARLRAESLTK